MTGSSRCSDAVLYSSNTLPDCATKGTEQCHKNMTVYTYPYGVKCEFTTTLDTQRSSLEMLHLMFYVASHDTSSIFQNVACNVISCDRYDSVHVQ